MKDYKYFFIDVDGTILDFQKAEVFAFNNTLSELTGLQPNADNLRLYSEINQSLWRDFEDHLINGVELKFQRALRFLSESGLSGDPACWAETYVRYLSKASFALPGSENCFGLLQQTPSHSNYY